LKSHDASLDFRDLFFVPGQEIAQAPEILDFVLFVFTQLSLDKAQDDPFPQFAYPDIQKQDCIGLVDALSGPFHVSPFDDP